MRSSVTASAPGKVILMGEHAAVYGRPALVAAIGLWARARMAAAAEPGVLIRLPDLGVEVRAAWGELASGAAAARSAWEAYAAAPTPQRFAAVRGDDPAHLVRVALGELAGEVAPGGDRAGQMGGAVLEVRSEIPIGSGCGSSAAVAVAVLAAGLAWLGEEPGAERLERLALEVERRQHGAPSGVDHNTVLRGGLVAARRRDGGGLALAPIDAREGLLERLSIFDTGAPAEPTGAVVAAVRRLRERDPETFEARLERMAAEVEAFRGALEGGPRDGGGRAEARRVETAARSIRRYERCLEELGVVPGPVRRRVAAVEASGGAAKISGAGSLGGPGAGVLMVLQPAGAGDLEAPLAGCRALEAELGVGGLTVSAG